MEKKLLRKLKNQHSKFNVQLSKKRELQKNYQGIIQDFSKVMNIRATPKHTT